MQSSANLTRRDHRDPLARLVAVAAVLALAAGCETPSAHTFSRNYGQRPDLPVDPPKPQSQAEDDCADGGRLFKLYCGSCHNARPLGERPFSNYSVAIAHMRSQAYLTGKEYRRSCGAGTMSVRRHPPWGLHPSGSCTPKPINELKEDTPAADSPPPLTEGPGPWQRPDAKSDSSSGQPEAAGTGSSPEPSRELPAPIR
jgi:hypothetical protein